MEASPFEQIPTRATYSQGRFLLQNVYSWVHSLTDGLAKTDLLAKAAALQSLQDSARDEILANGALQDPELIRQFGIEVTPDGKRVVDGNHHGFSFACAGVIVNGFALDRTCALGELKDVLIKDSRINGAVANIQEVVTVGNDNPFTDVAGGTLRIDEIVDTDGAYVSDGVHDLRFALAWWSDPNGGNDAELIALKDERRLGTLSIPASMGNWALNYDTDTRVADIETLMSNEDFSFFCNFDAMFHA